MGAPGMVRSSVVRALVIATLGLVLGGCGPVEYVNQVTRRASAQVAAAHAAGADEYAPYEITAAEAFLQKSREEAAYADFQAAIRFGRRAEELARKAVEISLARAGTEPLSPGEAPVDPSATPAAPVEGAR
jgi:hypothetical protein